jgi:hypothetical protein
LNMLKGWKGQWWCSEGPSVGQEDTISRGMTRQF